MAKQRAQRNYRQPAPALEELPHLDIRELNRFGLFETKCGARVSWKYHDEAIGTAHVECARDYVNIDYRYPSIDECWQHNRQCVAVDYTNPPLGGNRPWFVCPDCGHRCAKLYLDLHFKCRACTGRLYYCQRVDERHRLLARMVGVREQLEGLTVVGAFIPKRPKGMHRSQYLSLLERHRLLEAKLVQAERRHNGTDHKT